jgi:CoA:oxalate CoA-transferase
MIHSVNKTDKLALPLEGVLVLDFSQFLAGPSAAMRLADLGARVIKIEKPNGGDLCRQLYISNLKIDGDSTLFHSINRNKESYAADLKNPLDLERIQKLISRADVLIQNFRPGVIERIGLGYEDVCRINPRIIYASVSGYGKVGPWAGKPGQDLLAQAMSGLPFLNGDAGQPPVPFGLAVADLAAGHQLVQGILACMVRRGVTGNGGMIEVSLLESILDLQFEVFTTHLNDGYLEPERCQVNNAHAYVSAPYGIYETTDGFIALAMGSIIRIGEIISCAKLLRFANPESWFDQRDEIRAIIATHLKTQATRYWLDLLEPEGIWASDVFTWNRLRQEEGYRALDFEQETVNRNGTVLKTSRCPIRIDGHIMKSAKGAPMIGEDNETIVKEFDL